MTFQETHAEKVPGRDNTAPKQEGAGRREAATRAPVRLGARRREEAGANWTVIFLLISAS
jgi:hypothetical protein